VSTSVHHPSAHRRERLGNWIFWGAIAAFELLGVFLANHPKWDAQDAADAALQMEPAAQRVDVDRLVEAVAHVDRMTPQEVVAADARAPRAACLTLPNRTVTCASPGCTPGC
jgi:hypothetical protein